MDGANFFLKQAKGIAEFQGMSLRKLPDALLEWNDNYPLNKIKELNISNNFLNFLPIQLRNIEKVIYTHNPLLCYPPQIRTNFKWIK